MKNSETTWQNITLPSYPPLQGDITADIAIIGGGITGITTAYFLAKKGKKVVVIDRSNLKNSTTAYTSGFLTSVVDTEYSELVRIFDQTTAEKVLESHEVAIEAIEKIILEEGIQCQWKRVPHYSFSLSKKGLETLKKENSFYRASGQEAPIHPAHFFSFKNEGILERPAQGRFHPLLYLKQLREKVEELGGQFFEGTEAFHIEKEMHHRVSKEVVHTSGGKIIADDVVVATYNPFSQPARFLFRKGMYVSYIYELEVLKTYFREGLYEDDKNPYHYFRVDQGEKYDRVIIGGEDHRKEFSMHRNRSFHALEKYIEDTFPGLTYRIVRRWRGPILEPSDGLPLIGKYEKNNPHRYVATAFSGNGLTYGTIAGLILSNQIFGFETSWAEVYDPLRALPLKGILLKGRDYLEEFGKGVLKNMFNPIWNPKMHRRKKIHMAPRG